MTRSQNRLINIAFLEGPIRLAMLVFFLSLFSTTLATVAHEFIGHGLPALVFGETIEGYHLFFFGGGWVSYTHEVVSPGDDLVIALGGVTVEALMAILVFALCSRFKREPILRIWLIGYGSINLLHGLFYILTGLYWGMGDGYPLYDFLGDNLMPVIVPGTIITGVAAFLCAWAFTRAMQQVLPRMERPYLLATVAFAFVATGILRLALSWAELSGSDGYAVSRFQHHAAHHHLPYTTYMVGLMGACFVLGAWVAAKPTILENAVRTEIKWRDVAVSASLTALAIGVVGILRYFEPI